MSSISELVMSQLDTKANVRDELPDLKPFYVWVGRHDQQDSVRRATAMVLLVEKGLWYQFLLCLRLSDGWLIFTRHSLELGEAKRLGIVEMSREADDHNMAYLISDPKVLSTFIWAMKDGKTENNPDSFVEGYLDMMNLPVRVSERYDLSQPLVNTVLPRHRGY